MSSVFFYHLTESPLSEVLPVLISKARQAGWRICLRGRNPLMMQQLDQGLWTGDPSNFLPHGLAGGPHDADQPVLLTVDAGMSNGAQCLMSVDGADVDPGEVAGLERAMILFDGFDPDAVAHARTQWKAVTGAGVAAQYWAQENGRWVKKAES